MLSSYTFKTGKEGCYDITPAVREAISKNGIENGLCIVFCPHTTAGLMINENADPEVIKDLLWGLDKAFPDRTEFRHSEGNSAAHIKASCLGSSVTVIVEKGSPKHGTCRACISAISMVRVNVNTTSR
jgi:secondary thiamine-phosphate synthase enzyme